MMGAESATALSTVGFLLGVPRFKSPYSRRKFGYCSADILHYGRLDFIRGRREPKKIEKVEDGVLFAPGPRGMPTPVITIQKELDKKYQKELVDIKGSLEKADFEIKSMDTETSNPEEIAKAIMQRGNITVTLVCKKWAERFEWPSPSSFMIYSLGFDNPKSYVGNRVTLEYGISTIGETSEEEKILIKGIDAKLSQEHGFR